MTKQGLLVAGCLACAVVVARGQQAAPPAAPAPQAPQSKTNLGSDANGNPLRLALIPNFAAPPIPAPDPGR